MKKFPWIVLLLGMLSLLPGTAGAVDVTDTDHPSDMPAPSTPGQCPDHTGKRPPIPQFAIDACVGKKAGDTCTAGKSKGVCLYTPDKKYFACKPDDMKTPGANKPEHHGPPPE